MKRLVVLVLALLVLTLLTASVSGGGCRAVIQRSYAPYVAPIVDKAVVIEKVIEAVPTYLAQFIPVPVLTYGANYAPNVGYGPPQQGYTQPQQGQGYSQPLQQSQNVQQDQVLAFLQRMEQRLANLETKAGIAPQDDKQPLQMPKVPNGMGGGIFLKKHCAACHEASVARRDGGGFVWLNGDAPVLLTPDQRLKMIARVRAGQMPPPDNNKGIKPPSDEEFDTFLGEMTK